ncbi:GNAT family N-acetyltransferase [Nocardioides sp.]|uniref:GNAT family N-acetyltransferase n=1 Tax=Nocardioides sp. TaxID=35761 RepID=UPI002BD69D48|nr:GNAT family N-acetyltransferase [Nocardioides sp.]HXH80986.1 GNAT family N-acetyltransferase [Nocardioides sp.]
MNITIRAYAQSDWNAVARIHDSARLDELRASVGVEAFLDLAATYESEGLFDGDVWVAELDGDVVGFIAFDDNEVTWTYVHPVAYRRGVGRALLRHVLDRATEPVELTVLDGNDAARGLYESEGFQLEETRTGPLVGNETFTATGHIMVFTPRRS